MGNNDFDKLFKYIIIPAIARTRKSGGDEYARDNDNIFANFERVAEKLGSSVEDVIMTYTLKHIDGIVSHVNGEISQREDVRGRITDVIVYLSLFWAYLVKDEDLDKEIEKGFSVEKVTDKIEEIVKNKVANKTERPVMSEERKAHNKD